jgi:RNA polymerase sigma factor (sigma-70 family)
VREFGAWREPNPSAQPAAFWPSAAQVAQELARSGVPRRDIDDLCQEVLLVAVKRRPRLESDAAASAWLSEACHFVALTYRRKAYRRRELLERVDSQWLGSAPAVNDAVPPGFAADQLHAALARLSPREREIVALRLAADMPLRTLADLHECDVKTMRKRLLVAEAKLRKHLLLGGAPELAQLGNKQLIHVGAPSAEPTALAATAEVKVGAYDDTLILAWQGAFSEKALERFLDFGETLVKSRGPQLRCLSVIDPGWPVPRFDERRRISEAIRFLDRYCEALSLIGAQDSHRMLDQILRGLGFLEQARYSFGSFATVEAGATWLASRPALPAATTQAKAQRLVEAVIETQAEGAPARPAFSASIGGELIVHGVRSSASIVSRGNVMVSSWSGPVTQAAVNFLVGTADALRREHGPLAQLSVVEAESPTPRFAERQRLLEIARHCKRNLAVFGFVGQMSNIRIAEQIMRGLGFLARSSLLMCGTRSELEGADWLVQNGYCPAADPEQGRQVVLDMLAAARSARAAR